MTPGRELYALIFLNPHAVASPDKLTYKIPQTQTQNDPREK